MSEDRHFDTLARSNTLFLIYCGKFLKWILNRWFRVVCLIVMHFVYILSSMPISAATTSNDIHFCLVLVVKNDEAVITECLNSVKGLVDCMCVCDMGCTDNTIRLIKQFQLDNGIPGEWIYATSKDRALARNYCIEAAHEFIKTSSIPLTQYYLLSLDPHMILNIDPSFKKEELTEDSYSLFNISHPLSYCTWNHYVLRANLPWKDEGSVNSRWSCEVPFSIKKLKTLTIKEKGDDIYINKKLIEDKKVLNEVYKANPNAHCAFEIAQTYKGLKQWDEAIYWYEICLTQKGNSEELWFSLYRIGECYAESNRWDLAADWFLKAFQHSPDRAEPLQKLATHYRMESQNQLGYLFAQRGARIPLSQDQNLFPLPPLLGYEFQEELSITAYYTQFREEGFAAANTLLLQKNIPWHIKSQTFNNILFYITPLEQADFLPIQIDAPRIEEGMQERYHPMNPSICKVKNGYQLICRAVNYTQTGAKLFQTIDSSGIFKTRNFLVTYDCDFNVLAQSEIIENLNRPRTRAVNVQGLEDCRLFNFQDRFWFTCSTNDTNPTGNFQISLCRLPKDVLSTSEVFVEELIPLRGPDPNRCEKNWLPFIKDENLLIIYSYDPFIIYKPHLQTGNCETILSYYHQCDFSSFRGSAAPIEFDNGYLLLVHEVVYLPDWQRCYLHRFVYLDEDFFIQRVSKPFVFKHFGVEYCCSMTMNHAQTQLILPIGIEDHEAFLCFVDIDVVRSLLETVRN